MKQDSPTPDPPVIVKIIIGIVVIAITFFAVRSCNNSDTTDSAEDIQSAAFQIAKREVEKQLNNPGTADFSLTSVSREKFGDNTYRIKGTLTAENSFGVEQELRYTVTLTYFDGNPLNASNWSITTCDVKANR